VEYGRGQAIICHRLRPVVRPAWRHSCRIAGLTQVKARPCTTGQPAHVPMEPKMAPAPPPLEIDGAMVAQAIGLDVAAFRQLMADGKISVLCERGTGEDAGTWRASFYHGGRRARFVVDADGKVLDD